MSSNPYAAPKAPVAEVAAEGNFVSAGRAVGAGQGWTWIADGWNLFKKHAGMWIALIVVFAVLFIAIALVPFLGSLAVIVLAPVMTGGLMLGCKAQEEGGELQIGHLFAGFREHFAPLAAVGGIYLAASIVIALVVGLVTGAGMWALLGGGADPASVAGAGLTVLLAVLIMFALMLPVIMAMWFAPPLVVFHGQGAVEAMKNSFAACLKNIVPFLVYGVVLLVASIFATIPFGLGWLVLGPVIACSLYAAYRDIFFQ